ncbi:YchJ family protein [Saccharopolyspora indica]|uniref:YchJ family protein n=1 Tax=Saccharopolyspora indica TaxID=1229659 RepID=UPI0022EAEFC5|nr:YchJ family protein [Saccharopolyspora indica]MDA3648828.1 YchJ family protein [Saccharopolyspora indica]
MSTAKRCPCGLGEPFAECCAPLHSGERRASTAEQLMRSRFSAFAVGDAAYLLESWHPSTRPDEVELDPQQRWLHLEILQRTGGGPFDSAGTVRFRAHYRLPGEKGALTENSRFVKEGGAWFYVDGDHE